MVKKARQTLHTAEERLELQRASGRRLAISRCLIDENRTRFWDDFGVLTNRARMWEEGAHPIDIFILAEVCNRHRFTLDWIIRGRVGTLPGDVQAKIYKRYPEFLEDLDVRTRPSTGAASGEQPTPIPDAPAKGRRRRGKRSPSTEGSAGA